jgi:hypothetical protein
MKSVNNDIKARQTTAKKQGNFKSQPLDKAEMNFGKLEFNQHFPVAQLLADPDKLLDFNDELGNRELGQQWFDEFFCICKMVGYNGSITLKT